MPCEPRSFLRRSKFSTKSRPSISWQSEACQLMLHDALYHVYHMSHMSYVFLHVCSINCRMTSIQLSWKSDSAALVEAGRQLLFVSFCSIAALDLCKRSGDLGGPSDETWPNCQQLPSQPDGNMIHRPNSNPAILHDSTRWTACQTNTWSHGLHSLR